MGERPRVRAARLAGVEVLEDSAACCLACEGLPWIRAMSSAAEFTIFECEVFAGDCDARSQSAM